MSHMYVNQFWKEIKKYIEKKFVRYLQHCPLVNDIKGQKFQNQRNNSFASWRHQMETFTTLLVLCVGNSPVTGEFPSQRPVTRSFGVFCDLRVNKCLSKQSWGWWFHTPSRSLWRHCNDSFVCRFYLYVNDSNNAVHDFVSVIKLWNDMLTHWGRDKMTAFWQTTFSNAFSWMKKYVYRSKCYRNLFLWVQLTICRHLFRKWLGAKQQTSHYLN